MAMMPLAWAAAPVSWAGGRGQVLRTGAEAGVFAEDGLELGEDVLTRFHELGVGWEGHGWCLVQMCSFGNRMAEVGERGGRLLLYRIGVRGKAMPSSWSAVVFVLDHVNSLRMQLYQATHASAP